MKQRKCKGQCGGLVTASVWYLGYESQDLLGIKLAIPIGHEGTIVPDWDLDPSDRQLMIGWWDEHPSYNSHVAVSDPYCTHLILQSTSGNLPIQYDQSWGDFEMVHSDFKEISRGRSRRLGIHIYKWYKYQYLPATDVHPKKAYGNKNLHMAESPDGDLQDLEKHCHMISYFVA